MAQVTHRENLMIYGCMVFEICERTDRQTDVRTDTMVTIHCTPYWRQSINQTINLYGASSTRFSKAFAISVHAQEATSLARL